MEIKVRGLYRVLGLILAALFYSICLALLFTDLKLQKQDYYWFLPSFFVFFPVILSSSILGRLPNFLSRKLPGYLEEDLINTERFFKEFSAKSIGFAIGFLIVAFLSVYFWT